MQHLSPEETMIVCFAPRTRLKDTKTKYLNNKHQSSFLC